MAIAFSTGVLIAALGPFAPANLVSVGRAADGRGCHLAVTAEIEAPIEDVRAVVADFARYGEWFPAMQSAVQKTATEYEVHFHLPWPLKHVRERIQVAEERAGDAIIIRWRQLDGDFARNEGSWMLRSAGANRTAVRYDNVVQFRRWVPGWLVARAERRVAPQMLNAIQGRATDVARARSLAVRASR